MASQDRIDSIIIKEAIQKELDFMEKGLDGLKTQILGMPKIKNLIENSEGPRQLALATNELSKAQTVLASTSNGVLNTQRQLNSLQTVQQGIQEKITVSVNENVRALIRNKDALALNLATQKDLKKQLEGNTISQETYNQKMSNAIKRQLEYKEAIRLANKELKESTQIDFATPNTPGAAKAQNRQLTTLRDSIDVKDVDTIKELNDQIDRNNDLIDANSSKLEKQKINIGNYGSAFKGASNVIAKELAAIENKIAGGAFKGDALKDLIAKQQTLSSVVTTTSQGFTTLTGQTNAYKQAAQQLGVVYGTDSQVFKDFTSNVGEGVKQTESLNKSVKNATTSGNAFTRGLSAIGAGAVRLARLLPGIGIVGLISFGLEPLIKAFQRLTKSTGDSARQLKLLSDVNKELAKNAGQEISQLEVLYKVATNTNLAITERKKAVNELQEQYPAYFKNLNDEIILQGKAAKAYDATKLAILETAKTRAIEGKLGELATKELEVLQEKQQTIADLEKNRLAQVKANLKDQRDTESRGLDQFNAISKGSELKKELGDQNKSLAEIAKDREFLLGLITTAGIKTKKDPKDKTTGQISDLQKELNTEFEIYKIHQNRLLKIFEDTLNNERISYDDKLIALAGYNKASQDLVNEQERFEIDAKKREAAREIANLEKDKKGKNVAQIARINQNIKILENNLQQEILLIQRKASDDSLEIMRDTDAKRKKIYDDRLKVAKEFEEQRLALEEDLNEKLKTLDGKRLALQQKYEDNDLENAKKLKDAKIEFTREIVNGVQDIFTGALEERQRQEQEAYDADIERIDSRAQREIDAINRSVTSETEKARLIAGVEKQAAFEKEKIDKKKIESEKKFQALKKVAAIAEIATNTATSLFDIQRAASLAKAQAALFLARGNVPASVLAASQVPVILSAIPGVLAGAAIALAKVAFFKEGKSESNKYTGFAYVGDGGKHEYIKREDGTIEKTPNRPTLTHLMPNDVVYKDENALIKAMMAMSSFKLPSTIIQRDNGTMTEETGRKIVKAINQKNLSVNLHTSIPLDLQAFWVNQIKN